MWNKLVWVGSVAFMQIGGLWNGTSLTHYLDFQAFNTMSLNLKDDTYHYKIKIKN